MQVKESNSKPQGIYCITKSYLCFVQPSLGFDVVVGGGGGGGFLGFFFFLWFAELAILRLRSTGLTRHCFVPRKMADTCLVCFRYIRDIKPWNHLHMYTVVILWAESW